MADAARGATAESQDFTAEYEALIERLESMAGMESDKWKQAMLENVATTIRMWFLEGVPEWKQRARRAETELERLRAALKRIRDHERPVSEAAADIAREALRE